MEFITIYHLFRNSERVIWKVVPILVPKLHVNKWKAKGDFVLKEELENLNIIITKH